MEEELVKLIPAPPADLADWVRKRGGLGNNWLIFKCGTYRDNSTGKAVKCLDVHCTACGADFKVDRTDKASVEDFGHTCGYAMSPARRYRGSVGATVIEQWSMTICPKCGASVKCVHSSSVSSECKQAAWPMTVTRSGGNLILTGYRVLRRIDRNLRTEIEVNRFEAYIFSNGKAHRYVAWFSGFMGAGYFYSEKWEARKKFSDYFGHATHIRIDNKKVLYGTPLENCKLGQYIKSAGDRCYPVTYLRLYQKYPQIENLIVQGYGELVAEYVEQTWRRQSAEVNKTFNWKERAPARILGLAKMDFRAIKKFRPGCRDIRKFRDLRAGNRTARPDDIMQLIKVFGYSLNTLEKYGSEIWKLSRYLFKQSQQTDGRDKPDQMLTTWSDYIEMAQGVGYDIKDSEIRYPGRLQAAHDRLILAKHYRESPKLVQKFKEIYTRLEPLTWQKGSLLIRPAASENELIQEGKILCHCVGGYGQQHCEGSPIFFIRRADKPDIPYYTLQLSLKGLYVIQNRGYHNNMQGYPKKPPEIDAFADEWLENVVRPAFSRKDERIKVRATA